jgi:uncharacterized RDD family membrane protein YckC
VRSEPPAKASFNIDSAPERASALNIDSAPERAGALSIDSAPGPSAAMSIDSAPPQAGSFRIARSEPAPFVSRQRVASQPTNLELPFGGKASKGTVEAFSNLLSTPFEDGPARDFTQSEPRPAAATPPPAAARTPLPIVARPAAVRPAPPVVARAAPVSSPAASIPVAQTSSPVAPISVPVAPVVVSDPPQILRASGVSRLGAWCIDGALLAALAAGQILLVAAFTHHDWLDLALSQPLFPFWAVLTACDALACSWLFAAMGRTPGMAVLGQHLRTLDGELPTPAEALQRALLSLLSAAPALFGFSFALFDARGQTLHDKLCGCIVTVD